MHTGCLAGRAPNGLRAVASTKRGVCDADHADHIHAHGSDGQGLFVCVSPQILRLVVSRCQARSCRPLSLGSGKIRRRLPWERCFGEGWQLLKIRGIPLLIQPGWLVSVVLFTMIFQSRFAVAVTPVVATDQWGLGLLTLCRCFLRSAV